MLRSRSFCLLLAALVLLMPAGLAQRHARHEAKVQESAQIKNVSGGVTYQTATAFNTAYQTVVNFFKKNGYTIESADGDLGQIITAMSIKGGYSQTGTRAQVILIKDSDTQTSLRVAIVQQKRKKALQVEPWSDPKVNPAESEALAAQLKSVLPESATPSPAVSPAASQASGPAPVPRLAPPGLTTLTNNDVVEMVTGGLSPGLIASQIRDSQDNFTLTTPELIRLSKAGVPDSIIELMRHPHDAAAASAASTATTAAVPANSDNNPNRDIGVYIKKDGNWMEVRPEIVNWKTGGTLKSLASAGIVKKDLNGNIDGPSSKSSVKTPLEVLLVTPEGVAAEEYQFLRLRVNKDFREFRSVTGGILNQRSGAMRDLIPFEAKKLASRNFLIVVPQSIGAGEYGFLPPGAGGTSTTTAVSSQYGKMYTFHIIE